MNELQYKLEVPKQHVLLNKNPYPDHPLVYLTKLQRFGIKFLKVGGDLSKEKFWKVAVFDFDGVVNPPGSRPPFMHFLDKLIEGNDYIRAKEVLVKENLKRMQVVDDPTEPKNNLEEIFRKGQLTERLYDDACRYGANTYPEEKTFRGCVEKLRKMIYWSYFLSASPDRLIFYSKPKHGIEETNTEATEFKFKNGFFVSMELNLGDSRKAKRNKILSKEIHSQFGFDFDFYVDDNFITGSKVVTTGINHIYFWLTDAPPLPENISINLPRLPEDYSKFPRIALETEVGFLKGIVFESKEYAELVVYAHDAIDFINKMLNTTGYEAEVYRDKALWCIDKYLNEKMKMFFPVKSSRINFYKSQIGLFGEKMDMINMSKIKRALLKNSVEADMPRGLFN